MAGPNGSEFGAAGASAGAESGAAGTAGAAGSAGAAAAATGQAGGLFGLITGAGWLGYVATAVLSTAAIGVSVFGVAVKMPEILVGQVAALPFQFEPDKLVSRLQDTYTEQVKQQAAALVTSAGGQVTELTQIGQGQTLKIASVNSNIVAQALQDKANLTQIQQTNDAKAAFKTSDDTKVIFEPPKPSNAPPPPPSSPAGPPPGSPSGVTSVGNTTIIQTSSGPPAAAPPAAPVSQPAPPAAAPVSAPVTAPAPAAPPADTAPAAPPAAPPVVAPPASAPPASAPPDSAPPSAPPASAPPSSAPPVSAPPSNAGSAPAPTDTPVPTATSTVTPTPTNTPTPTSTPTPTITPLPVGINNSLGGSAIFSVSGLAPGGSISRTLTINDTSGTFTYALSTSCTANCTSPMWTNATTGLQLTIKRGTTTVYNGPMQISNQPIYDSSGTNTAVVLTTGQSDALTITASLPNPGVADNTMQGESVTLTFTWTGTSTT